MSSNKELMKSLKSIPRNGSSDLYSTRLDDLIGFVSCKNEFCNNTARYFKLTKGVCSKCISDPSAAVKAERMQVEKEIKEKVRETKFDESFGAFS